MDTRVRVEELGKTSDARYRFIDRTRGPWLIATYLLRLDVLMREGRYRNLYRRATRPRIHICARSHYDPNERSVASSFYLSPATVHFSLARSYQRNVNFRDAEISRASRAASGRSGRAPLATRRVRRVSF